MIVYRVADGKGWTETTHTEVVHDAGGTLRFANVPSPHSAQIATLKNVATDSSDHMQTQDMLMCAHEAHELPTTRA